MFDPAALLEYDVEEIRHVAGREDARRARFEILVDQDAVAKPDAAVAKKPSLRRHADRDDHQVAWPDFAGARHHRLHAAGAL